MRVVARRFFKMIFDKRKLAVGKGTTYEFIHIGQASGKIRI